MGGIHYITDSKGKRVGVQIDLRKHGEFFEDFYDAWMAHKSDGDELIDWEEAKRQLNNNSERTRSAAKRQHLPVKRSKPVKK
jgi:hypothetical protein